MLRARRASQDRKAGVRVDYDDPYLSLTSLLVDAATLEHSLLATYLYALFSIKDKYEGVRGSLSGNLFQPQPPWDASGAAPAAGSPTFLEVTIEEMQHLALVNMLLRELGAAPCLERHSFPYVCEIYPFPLELRALDRYAAATYTWIEASAADLNLRLGPNEREDERVIVDLKDTINARHQRDVFLAHERAIGLEHIGSLYDRILECMQSVRNDPPAFVSPDFAWATWVDRLRWIRHQGELRHFVFFRDLFTGRAFGADHTLWEDPMSPDYPSIALPWQTAFGSRKGNIEKGAKRDLAWLANLLYWTLLALLDLAYRRGARKLIYTAIEQMTSGLWCLGLHLAQHHGVGMPFDVMLVRYTLGRDDPSTLAIIGRLLLEAKGRAERLRASSVLPILFDMQLFDRTLAALEDPGWSR